MNVQEYLTHEISLFSSIITEQLRSTPPYLRGRKVYGFVTGSGDSFVAAKMLELLTNYRLVAKDPYELRLNLPALKGGYIVGISVKGRTKEVIRAVKSLKERGWLSIALTSDLTSPLAKSVDEVIKLHYGGGELPIGVGNFVSSVTAVAALSGVNVSGTLIKAKTRGSVREVLEGNDLVLIGDPPGYLAGEFISLKLSEIFCRPSRVLKIEQFLHAPIYSLQPSSTILFLGNDVKVSETYKILKELNNDVAHLGTSSKDPFSSFLSYIYTVLQELAREAGTRNISKPCFMTRKFLLERTTPVIYG